MLHMDRIRVAMLLYYITDRTRFAGSEGERRRALLHRIAEASRAGVNYIQLREKDLIARDLESLARDAVQAVRENSNITKLLINGRTDVALACRADGVHLPAGELAASEIRTVWMKCSEREPLIGVSAHCVADVRYAEAHGANFAVLAPIFEKVQTNTAGMGIDVLRAACAASLVSSNVEAPYRGGFAVLALGGVNLSNARACIAAGAAGVAGIRLFQEADVHGTVRRLRP
jgi:thiamine-phosphate pyrophosphorylase